LVRPRTPRGIRDARLPNARLLLPSVTTRTNPSSQDDGPGPSFLPRQWTDRLRDQGYLINVTPSILMSFGW
jgi:hypothetical protein